MRSGSRTAPTAIALLASVLTACAEGARMARTTDDGGIVIYPFKESGSLLSPFRKEALALMEQRCGGPYRVIREGETKGRGRVSEHPGGMEMVQERRWGIEFICKGKTGEAGP